MTEDKRSEEESFVVRWYWELAGHRESGVVNEGKRYSRHEAEQIADFLNHTGLGAKNPGSDGGKTYYVDRAFTSKKTPSPEGKQQDRQEEQEE